jgi:phosphopantothenoylcysteine decarboxylase / phosphopantothenate---cysteine ligase
MAKVVVGVTGGIAAYKSAQLIRLFTEAGHTVQVVATQNALNFIGKATLEALSKNQVSILDPDLFTDVDQVKHIAIAKSAELVVVAPATASFLAKIASGIADDLLTTTVLAATCPVVVAPAMHTEMWENAATRANVAVLEKRGISIVWPGIGRLTGEDSGVGRLAEPEEIFESSIVRISTALRGVRVLVTAGGTREPIDPARFIGNYSSGKQGVAFARAAKLMGASVQLLAANLDPVMVAGIDTTHVQTTAQLKNAIDQMSDKYDLLIMAAAVADYSPVQSLTEKMKRSELGERLNIELIANPDLLAGVVNDLKARGAARVTVGFAAESSSELEALARKKLLSKQCDYIVANDISNGAVFGQDDTSVLLISEGKAQSFNGSKQEVAAAVLSEIATKMEKL